MAGSSSRGRNPNIIIIHTGEGILNRNDMAAFLDRASDASAHAASDAGGVVAPLVPYDRASWTAGPTANSRGIQIEICAFAQMTRDQWLSRNDVTIYVPWLKANRTIKSPYNMLVHTANWARDVANRYGIEKNKIGAAQLRAGQSGICGHADTSQAWGETDHTDPGNGFPWDVFINLVKGGDGVSAEEVTTGLFNTRVENKNVFDWFKQQGWDHDARMNKILASITTLAGAVAKTNDLDEAKIAAAIVPALVAALPQQLKDYNDEQVKKIAKEVNDELARRQAN